MLSKTKAHVLFTTRCRTCLQILTLLLSPSVTLASATTLTAHVNVHPLYLEDAQDSDYVFNSIRDNEGFIWLGTDNGIKRYDGYNFKRFIASDSEHSATYSNRITTFLLHSSGALWAAGRNLMLYQPKTETFNAFNVTGSRQIESMIEGSEGTIWLAGRDFGLIGFNPENKETTRAFFSDLDQKNIIALAKRPLSPELWVATHKGLYLFNPRTYESKKITVPQGSAVSFNNIKGLVEDKKGNLWIARPDELIVFNNSNNSINNLTLEYSLSKKNNAVILTTVLADNNNDIWVGTAKSGIFKYISDQNIFEHFPSTRNDLLRLPESQIEHIQQDTLGNIWISAGESGLYRISEHLEKFITRQRGFWPQFHDHYMSHNRVMGLVEGDDENIWIATDGGGLNRYSQYQREFSHYLKKSDQSIPDACSDHLVAIEKSPDGKIWVASDTNRLCYFDPDQQRFFAYQGNQPIHSSNLGLRQITSLFASDNGTMFVGSRSLGFFILDLNTGEQLSFPASVDGSPGSRSRSVYSIAPYKKNTFWIGGDAGLDLYNASSGVFTPVNLPTPVGVHDIHRDEFGSLWLATTGGLISYHPQTKVSLRFSKKDGLIDDFVLGIEEDERRNLWLSTRHGISRFSMQTQEFTSYTGKDGLAGSRFNFNAHLTTANGYMFFGGPNGLSIFKPNHLPTNDHAPQVHLTDIEMIENTHSINHSVSLSKHLNLTDQLQLPSTQKELVFEFSAMSFISPSQNRYKYRLIGLENEWIDATSKHRRVRYTNLSPGSYVFQVLGSNNEGVWAGRAKQVPIEILPAWWQTWWAKGLMVIMIIASAQAFSLWRLRITRARKEELEYVIQERTQELDRANQAVVKLNSELEQRVLHRTRELSIEIEERKNAEERSSHLALHDPLTGLPNRAWLLDHLQMLLDRARIHNFKFAVLFIGGDRFKQINDTHGHLLGDMLLVAAAQRLKSTLPKHYHCVRLGSDEFTVVLDEVSGEQQAEEVAQSILTAFDAPFIFEQAKMKFSVSIGLLVGDQDYRQPAQILRNADIAMNHAKNKGRGIYQAFDQEILEQTLDYASLQADLQQALKRSQFELVYQPIIDFKDDSVSGFEALLRWKHPTRGYVPPDKFIPIAEEIGMIFEIGLWVLERACEQLNTWSGMPSLKTLPSIAVNLSALQLKQADLISRCDQIFEHIGELKKKIKLEITESALMENTAAVDQLLDSFRERGIELAIDDFGTGYSSLSYLDKLPVQVLKIDRSFVSALYPAEGETGNAHEIVRATISLAHNLNMRVVAEGIETEKELNILKEYLCDYGQGYLIAKPLQPQAATEFLMSKDNAKTL